MKTIATLLLFSAFLPLLSAQQIPLFTQYREYHTLINPAAVTSDFLTYEYNMSAGLSYRKQFAGIPNGIENQSGQFNWLSLKQKLLVSGFLLRDKTGPSSTVGGYGRIGYILSYDPRKSGFAFGLNIGALQYGIKVSDITFVDEGDVMATQNLTKVYPDVGFGAFYYTSLGGGWEGDKIYAGVSVPQMFGLDLNLRDASDNEFRMTRIQHFYAHIGLLKYINENSFIEPSVWVKYVPGAPVNVDCNFRVQLSQILFLGAGYATSKDLHLEVGLQLGDILGMENKLLRLGYGFDRYFSQIGPVFGATHEINLVYSFSSASRRR